MTVGNGGKTKELGGVVAWNERKNASAAADADGKEESQAGRATEETKGLPRGAANGKEAPMPWGTAAEEEDTLPWGTAKGEVQPR